MGEIMAGVAITGIGLAFIISAAEVFKRYIAYKEKQLASGSDQSALEERVRVLERIVTEGRNPLADEIEALRDNRNSAADAGVPLAFTKERV